MSSKPHIRYELAIITGLTLVGFLLRVWQISDLGLDHFDEGVYAFSALGLTDPQQPFRLYPGQIQFSPPVYFSLVGLAYLLGGGPSDIAAFLVNVILGTLTIPVIWKVGRTWFRPSAGLAAAALLAVNEYHISLSRTALTDVPFALFFLIAVAAIVRAVHKPGVGRAVVAGLAIGLAWNTKYHGWLALVIAGLAIFPILWRQRNDWRYIRRMGLLFGLTGGSALIAYLPWALFIQSQPGGYLALAQYQRTLLSRQWFHNLEVQAMQQWILEGSLSRASPLVAFLLLAPEWINNQRDAARLLGVAAAVGAAGLLLGASGAALLATALAARDLQRNPSSYPLWLILSWTGLWIFMTPLYHPYARLVLPLTLATFLGAGAWMSSRLAGTASSPTPAPGPRLALPMIGITAGVILVMLAAGALPDPTDPWRPARSVPEAAVAIERIVPGGMPVVVIGEPSLAFYLHINNRPTFQHVQVDGFLKDLEALPAPTFVITGVYTQRAPSLRQGLERLEERLTPLGTFGMNPKDVRVMDDFPPEKAMDYRRHPDDTYRLSLYTLQPRER